MRNTVILFLFYIFLLFHMKFIIIIIITNTYFSIYIIQKIIVNATYILWFLKRKWFYCIIKYICLYFTKGYKKINKPQKTLFFVQKLNNSWATTDTEKVNVFTNHLISVSKPHYIRSK
jgi:hypothetical protein